MYSKNFLEFINEAKTPFHAVKGLASRLEEKGYKVSSKKTTFLPFDRKVVFYVFSP